MYIFLLGAEINVILEVPRNVDRVKAVWGDMVEEIKSETQVIIRDNVEDKMREIESNKAPQNRE